MAAELAHLPDSYVLLVDDDPATAGLLSRWLQEAGYRVSVVASGQEALAAVKARCPGFLIIDWRAPSAGGLELCNKVRSLQLPHYVYILFVSADCGPERTVACLEAGADHLLAKPVHRGELLARMRSGRRLLELEGRLREMARTDPLTGLLTRRTFYELLLKEWHRAQRKHLPLSCVMADIDFFKRIDDIHGHPAGDAVLKAVAKLISDSCRASDSVCRYGGEEFCVLLPETDEQGAAVWAERVRKRLEDLVVPVGGKQLRVTASFGVAQKYDDTQTPEQLVDQADQALLCAKQSGRDRVVSFVSLTHASSLDLESSDEHADLFSGFTARDVMTPVVVCLREDETVGHAVEFFLRSRINSTPVVDKEGKLAGILSEKDLMAALVCLESWSRPVREAMKPNVICYEENAPIRTIYEFLCRVSIRRVVIVNQGRPTGTVSQGTLLRWFRNLVITKGLLGSTELVDQPQGADPYRSKERLAETARELALQASGLHDRFLEDADDLMPYVVGGATRMEELVNDLLAYSRYANETAQGAVSVQSLYLSSSHTD